MNTHIKKSLTAGALAFAIMTTALPAQTAAAATQAELQAQIQALLAQIASLQAQVTPGSSVSITLNRDLAQGMTGEDVRQLQKFLNNDPATIVAVSGVGAKGNETTYFGPATKAAVIKFQNKYKSEVLTPSGLVTGTGYVGPATRAKINALGAVVVTPTPAPTPTPTPTPAPDTDDEEVTDPIVATEGDILVTRGGEHTSTLELSGDFDEIYSVDIKADDSAMTINRMDFIFDKQPWRYIDSFVLYQEGKKVGEMKATENNFSKVGSAYRLRFTGLSAVVKDGDKDTFVLEAKALKNLSSSREADTLTVYVPQDGVRAIDTAKLTTQEPSSDLTARTFDFRDSENDGALVVTRDSSSPETGLIEVAANKNTTGTVLVLDVKAKDNDISLTKAYVKVSSSVSDASKVVRRVSLVHDGDVIATESVLKNGATAITGRDEDGNIYTIIDANEYYVYFDDIEDIDISEDDRTTVTVRAEFNKANGTAYSNGTTVNFIVRHIVGDNEAGEDVINGDLTVGSNRTFTLTSDGVSSKTKDFSATVSGKNNDFATYTMSLIVTAFGDDIYLPRALERQVGTTTAGTAGVEYSLKTSGAAVYADGTGSGDITVRGAKSEDGYYKLSEGNSYTIELEVALDNRGATEGSYRLQLETLRYRVGSTTGPETTITTGFADYETKGIFVRS